MDEKIVAKLESKIFGSLLIQEFEGKRGGHPLLSVAAVGERLASGVVELTVVSVICRHKSQPSTIRFLA